MFRVFRFRLRPSRAQYARLGTILQQRRQLYDAALQERRDAWRLAKASITRPDQHRSLTTIRADDLAGYGAIAVAKSRWMLARVDAAIQGFFKRIKDGQKAGFPCFCTKDRFHTIGFGEPKRFRLQRHRLTLKGVEGALRLKAATDSGRGRDPDGNTE